jgi:misacylated tRNA(Ala) deacylase
MTEAVFREDAYRDRLDAVVTAVTERGPVFDRTIFYATGGGQPGDTGWIELADGTALPVTTATYADATKTGIIHEVADPAASPSLGTKATLVLDFPPRLRRMRMHTGLHLLSVVLPYPVTGGAIGDAEGRLDFDIPDPNLDRDAIQAAFDALVAGDHPVTSEWITDAELDANPGLVKTMSVKPPRGSGRVRLVRIGGADPVDLQPCGGTHVRSTAEVGRLVVTKIEKKGKLNRRVRMAFAEDL